MHYHAAKLSHRLSEKDKTMHLEPFSCQFLAKHFLTKTNIKQFWLFIALDVDTKNQKSQLKRFWEILQYISQK